MLTAATLALLVAPSRLSAFDLVLVAAYLIGITLFGLSFRKKKGSGPADKSLKSYFLANNTIPWWAIALSIVSAETSTLTIISIPGVAFAGDFGFLQIVLGYMLGRIVVAALFLPRYFAGEMLTAYQLIDRRFGPTLHKVTAGLFLLTRAAAEGVRVFAVSIVVGIAIGTGDILSIAIISALTLLYTFEGGMTAVIWTDVVQMAIYIGGTFVAIWSLGHHVAGGWNHIQAVASAAGKFHMFNFALNLTTTYTFWAGVLGGTFLTMASHGTDQLMVQRMLAARNLHESRLALLSSGVVIFLQFFLFLLIGVGLYVFYSASGGNHALSPDRIFPTFIVHDLPVGIAGLLVAAILAAAMSNLSAALNSLSSTTVVDFYMRFRSQADSRERNLISKSSTVLWALVLFAIAVYSIGAGGKGHVVEIGLSISAVAWGCLLGVFLLGTLTKFATEIGATIGMICGFALNIVLWQFPDRVIFWGRSGPDFVNSSGQLISPVFPLLTIPHIAWTWYVLIGALVTFAIGTLASLVFRKQSRRAPAAIAVLLASVSFIGANYPSSLHAQTQHPSPAPTSNFTQISDLITTAIAAHKLPGAVVMIGHGGHIVFHHAYGDRKLAGEPGPQGELTAEPMTEDTIFDMASLTKCLATATAVMQLYEAGKIASFDDPVEKYLPAFNPAHDKQRAKVTLRMLLTHTSGEPPDVDLRDPWGLAASDKQEGFRRALATPLKQEPGPHFEYSDINFILLGLLVETLSGQPEDVYTREHIFNPLGMAHTRYLPIAKACGLYVIIGAAIELPPHAHHEGPDGPCTDDQWLAAQWIENIAPTTHDDESKANPAANPHFDHLTHATVHDPTTRRMGGVAGHAGVFSTAYDVSLFAQALLDKLLHNTGPFPLKQATLQLMTQPEQPGHTAQQEHAANAALDHDRSPTDPLLAKSYPAIAGQNLRGFGWDIDTGFSKPRGAIFPIGSFGHTGFTGTSLWMDPASDTYVILLANAIHPRGSTPISALRGEVATAAAKALHLDLAQSFDQLDHFGGQTTPVGMSTLTGIDVLEQTHFEGLQGLHHIALLTNQTGLDSRGARTIDILASLKSSNIQLTTLFSPEHGIFGAQDSTHINAETDPVTGLHVTSLYGAHDADRRPCHEQLQGLDAVVIDLQDAGVRFYTYETVVGYFLEAAARERYKFQHGLQIILLDRPDPIGGDRVQGPVSDAGSESYINYMPLPVRHGLTLGELAQYINGERTLPASEPTEGTASNGLGGIHATHTPPMMVGPDGILRHPDGSPAHGLGAHLTVIPMQNWTRSEYFDTTGLAWHNPSPNLRSVTAATLYPGLGFLDFSGISVGRGTATPFEGFGAGLASMPVTHTTHTAQTQVDSQTPNSVGFETKIANDSKTVPTSKLWFDAPLVAHTLNARHIPGVSFEPTTMTIAEDANRYPFHGQTIPAVHINITDRTQLDAPELGLEILSTLHKLYPAQIDLAKSSRLIASQSTLDALVHGDDPRSIATTWRAALDRFLSDRAQYLLYK